MQLPSLYLCHTNLVFRSKENFTEFFSFVKIMQFCMILKISTYLKYSPKKFLIKCKWIHFTQEASIRDQLRMITIVQRAMKSLQFNEQCWMLLTEFHTLRIRGVGKYVGLSLCKLANTRERS